MTTTTQFTRIGLRGGSALRTLALMGAGLALGSAFAMPAFAQEQDTQTTAPAATSPAQSSGDIVVTGSLLRRTDRETPSPVTTLTTEDLEKRGVQTVQAALQTLSSNNGPAITNSWNAQGNFAQGAATVSLRGLTSDSTLVLFDGLRAAYYPLADDGVRNFVDLNTIPDEIVDHVEVLNDGASATYGADAIAGVVNIITKKEVTGVHGTVEAGATQRGDAANQRLSLTVGHGHLDEDGYNVYLSGHYIHTDALRSKQRGYPYNTDDETGICAPTGPSGARGKCGPNNIRNGSDNGTFTGFTDTTVPFVRPYDSTNTTALGRYQLLNTDDGCRDLTPNTLSDADYNDPANASAPRTVCQLDYQNRYGVIEPETTRYGGSGRFTANLGDNTQVYAELNYERSEVHYTGGPSTIRNNAPTGIDYPQFSTAASGGAYAEGSGPLTLPVYVCPERVNCDTAADGVLNPNNPFAADGEVARVAGLLPDSRTYTQTISQAYRAAAGIDGSFGDDWRYSVHGTAMKNVLDQTNKGYVYIQHLLDEVADGSLNLMNPSANSQATLDYLHPDLKTRATSQEYQVDANLAKDLFQLPGGPLQVAIGGSYRHEAINDPSINPDYDGPTERYFTLNAFGTVGKRDVESGYFEINAPIITQFEIDGSGRYDHYSTGASHFSPKIGAKFTPFKQLLIRGTFSKGFRIPSFAEANSLPTTGYVTVAPANLPASFVNQHLNANGDPNTYITSYSIGETTLGNPNLKPEKSTNFTVGAVFEPIRNVSFSVTYYNIKKTDAITGANLQPAIDAYYAGEAIPEGYTVIPDAPDVNAPAGAMPRIAFVQAGYVNANTIKTSGLDFGAEARFKLGNNMSFESSANATYIINLDTAFPDGSVEHYAGTLGNFNLTAGSGTFRWKANWQNTLNIGDASFSATAYYTSGYNLSAEDQGNVAGDCGLSSGYSPCNVHAFFDVDFTASYKVNDNFTFYGNILNVADAKPPLDPVTYGGYLYNPVQADAGIIGRAFRFGARFGF